MFLIYLPITFLLYALFSARHLAVVIHHRTPRPFQRYIELCFPGPPPGVRVALGSYLAWTVFTQVAPLLVALSSTSSSWIRVVSVVEMIAAAGWTAYLLRRGTVDT